MLKLFGIIIVIYLFFRVLTTYIFPWMVRKYLERVKEKFYEKNPSSRERMEKRKGEMTIIYENKEQGRPDSDKLGEYTDFEEIDKD